VHLSIGRAARDRGSSVSLREAYLGRL